MTTPLNQASLGLAKEYSLTQAEYHALVRGFKIAMKFNPPSLVLQNSNLMAFTEDRMAFIQADYHSSEKDPLVKPLVTMAFVPDKAVIKEAKAIRGEGNVRISFKADHYHIHGDHTDASFPAIPVPDGAYFAMPPISWFGAKLSEYDSKDFGKYIGKIGKGKEAVHLAVYGDQLEQVWVNGASGPYTFTAGMAERLASRIPSLVLKSQDAFRFIGHKQTLQIGTLNDQYVLRATTPIDMGVDLVVTEVLDVVSAS